LLVKLRESERKRVRERWQSKRESAADVDCDAGSTAASHAAYA